MLICNPRFARLADQRFGPVLFSALDKYRGLGAQILYLMLPDHSIVRKNGLARCGQRELSFLFAQTV
jgi:hypothetical protein